MALHLVASFARLRGPSSPPVCALFLDQSKAYDRIDWHWLSAVLTCLGCPIFKVQWLYNLLASSSTSVLVDGIAFSPFSLSHGLPQGCSLSPILYALSLEPLLAAFSCHLSRYPLPALHISHLAFANDVALFLTGRKDFRTVSHLLTAYSSLSGASLNSNKTDILWLGPPSSPRFPIPFDSSFNWRNARVVPLEGDVRYLGVHFSRLGAFPTPSFWDSWFDSLESSCSRWSSLHLSILGCIRVTNVWLLSRLWFFGRFVPFPSSLALRL